MKNNKGKYFSANTAILLNCLGIAVLFFIMTKLSKNYTYKLPFHITYTSFPENKIPSQSLVDNVEITVSATGFNILSAMISGGSKIQLPLESFQGVDYILCNENLDFFNSLMPKEYNAFSIQPDTLPLYFSKQTKKTVPVKLNSIITFQQQYDAIEDILTEPDSIELSGTEESLKNIEFWPTDTLKLINLKETVQGYLPLKQAQELNIDVNPNQIKYLQTVEEFTEAVVNAKIKIINSPDSSEIIIFPKNVSVKYQVGLSSYEKSKEESFEVVADFKDIDLSSRKSIGLKLLNAPFHTKKHKISPSSVDFILYKDKD